MSRYHFVDQEEFIVRNRKFTESRSEDKVKTVETIYHQLKCLAQHEGLDVPDLYMMVLYIKEDIEEKAPSVKGLEQLFVEAKQKRLLEEAIEEDRFLSGN